MGGVGRGFADNAHDFGVLLETFIAARTRIVPQDFAFVKELDAMVVISLCFTSGKMTHFADCDSAIGYRVGREV